MKLQLLRDGDITSTQFDPATLYGPSVSGLWPHVCLELIPSASLRWPRHFKIEAWWVYFDDGLVPMLVPNTWLGSRTCTMAFHFFKTEFVKHFTDCYVQWGSLICSFFLVQIKFTDAMRSKARLSITGSTSENGRVPVAYLRPGLPMSLSMTDLSWPRPSQCLTANGNTSLTLEQEKNVIPCDGYWQQLTAGDLPRYPTWSLC